MCASKVNRISLLFHADTDILNILKSSEFILIYNRDARWRQSRLYETMYEKMFQRPGSADYGIATESGE